MILLIIDCHVHVKGGDAYRREFPAEYIIQTMDEAGIDKSIIHSICLPPRESNDLTYREVMKFPDRLIGFAHALPKPELAEENLTELERAVKDLGFRGVKIHFGEVGGKCSMDLISPIIDETESLGVPCLIDSAGNLDLIREIVEAHPNAKIIFAHLGNMRNEILADEVIRLAEDRSNVYLDTSYVRFNWKIADALERAGPEKLIFGSDGPLIHPLCELAKIKVLKFLAGAETTMGGTKPITILKEWREEYEEMILYRNIARLIGLEEV
ncbi:MAG TPA: amidohydrolase [Candidatus Korarchaeota archaeon]|nr:amidohydrolase [Candidatus Korarchaeota archaeon]